MTNGILLYSHTDIITEQYIIGCICLVNKLSYEVVETRSDDTLYDWVGSKLPLILTNGHLSSNLGVTSITFTGAASA